MKIFGSDGFRCEFGYKYMTPNFLMNFSNAVGDFYLERNYNKPILIAMDTRESGKIIESLISAILMYKGIKVNLAGIVPTPALSKIIEIKNYSLGIMITASHNDAKDNGIKLFNSTGLKLKETDEMEIEKKILKNSDFTINVNERILLKDEIDGALIYSNFLLNKFSKLSLKNKVLIDCAHGACGQIAKNGFRKIKNIEFINVDSNGKNINYKSGALEGKRLLKILKKKNILFGAAFDGDGDRCIFVSKEYGEIETEKMIFLFYKYLFKKIKSKKVISTEICNLALSENLNKIGLQLIETEVGDRNVVETAIKEKAILGAEPSGHFFFSRMSRSMDGFLTLLHFLKLIEKLGDKLPDILKKIDHHHRITKNINAENFSEINLKKLKNIIMKGLNHKQEKMVVRLSIWEPTLRMYYDFKEQNNFKKLEKTLLKRLKEFT
tara:strand:+ start:9015 stop:10328 length:1314 start_codon:yes stop_codon:yes gene_type:complete